MKEDIDEKLKDIIEYLGEHKTLILICELWNKEYKKLKSQLQKAKNEVYKLKDEVGDRSSAFLLSQQENSRLREALKDLYKAGYWSLPQDIMDDEEQVDLWQKAKEALNQLEHTETSCLKKHRINK